MNGCDLKPSCDYHWIHYQTKPAYYSNGTSHFVTYSASISHHRNGNVSAPISTLASLADTCLVNMSWIVIGKYRNVLSVILDLLKAKLERANHHKMEPNTIHTYMNIVIIHFKTLEVLNRLCKKVRHMKMQIWIKSSADTLMYMRIGTISVTNMIAWSWHAD